METVQRRTLQERRRPSVDGDLPGVTAEYPSRELTLQK
jgi:hypothetical protein